MNGNGIGDISLPHAGDAQVDITQSELVEHPGDVPGHEAGDVETLKTGTTTVGLKADDGVVLATDMRASLGNMVSSKQAKKVEQIHPTAAITISGSVSAAQSLISTIEAEAKLYEIRRDKEMSMNALASMLGNLLRSGAYFIVVPILGGVDDEGPHIYSLDALGGRTEEEYTVSGSGSQFALGLLENRFEEDLSMDEAEDLAIDAVLTAIERDTASGDGLYVSRITADGVEIDEYDDLDELR
ncbi:archaeal proteasome endopeptidase complex subunit beta [Haloarcula litorea]|uniref:archaeal proteasome endopeptidase complex subunit beta n=1 Tax=Haloarcula litorea TaxID=3032579 RepID=UPI0023E7A1B2|nr:archaeal proteasome endopeptidase complex subunit beta [Halomicroarcula sp. GDY20]